MNPHTPAVSTGHLDGLSYTELAQEALALCERIAQCSEEPGRITRTYLSEAMREAHSILREAMEEAGLAVRIDAAGNLIGRRAAANAEAPVLLLGSHIDSVRNAGRYDGVLGIAISLAAIHALRHKSLPFTIDVIAFSEEEGVRFQRPYLGSAAVAGCFDPAWLELRDSAGISLREAITHYGGDPAEIPGAAYPKDQVLGFVECHIEQGPRLEQQGRALGVVSGIAGQTRMRLRLRGEAGHAGTVPMNTRCDALAGAAEIISSIETVGCNTPGLVATVGWLQVRPNIPNVIPDTVDLSIDVRHLQDSTREMALELLEAHAAQIAEKRGLALETTGVQHTASIKCDAQLTQLLDMAVRACGHESMSLPSGAGHDAVVMAKLCAMAMLFLRCKGGISHHPEESVQAADVAAGIEAMTRFIELFSRNPASFDQHTKTNKDNA